MKFNLATIAILLITVRLNAQTTWSVTGNSGTLTSDFLGTTDNKPLKFRTNNTQVMVLDENGNLETYKGIKSKFIHLTETGTYASIRNLSPSNNFEFVSTHNFMFLTQSGHRRFFLKTDGDFLLGGGSGEELSGIGSANGTNHLIFKTNGSPVAFPIEQMRLTSTGNLLIGTTTDGNYKLDVNGKLRISQDAFINGLTLGRGTANSDLNVVFGKNVFNSNTTGAYNVAIGTNALYYNTTGNSNTAVGYTALQNNTIGQYNTAIGSAALMSNTGGGYNTAVGYAVLQGNLTGGQNVGIGNNSLMANSTGDYNTSMGGNVLQNNTTGSYNSGIGYRALTDNQTGWGNLAFGGNSLAKNVTGHHNIALGYNSLTEKIPGDNNIGIGGNAGNTLTDGNNNILIGYNVQPTNVIGSNQLNIGNWIYGVGGNIGIGAPNPSTSAKLEVASTTQGFLAPRMTTTQKNAITTPAAGLMVYDNSLNAYNYYNGTSWQGMGGSGSGSAQWTLMGSDLSYTSGSVGIGTAAVSGYKLAVTDGIITEKVKVRLKANGWPDYVFEKNYSLMTLEQVELFINEHKHLPGMPTAKEVGEEGLNLGENQALLLKKIEELTLYMIEMKKEQNVLKEENEVLKKEIMELKRKK